MNKFLSFLVLLGLWVSTCFGAVTQVKPEYKNQLEYQNVLWNAPLGSSAVAPLGTNAMIVIWETATNNTPVTLPYRAGQTYNCTVDWGDGSAYSTVNSNSDPDATHTYALAGTYLCTIEGQVGAWYFNNGGSKARFKGVNRWGDVTNSTVGLEWAFYGSSATNFATPVDARWVAATNLIGTWLGCTAARYFPDVSALTNVINLGSTWNNCTGATNFPDVSALTNVINLGGTWYNCTATKYFPDVSALTNVTSLGGTWYNCTAATNFPDVSALTKVTSLYETWCFCRPKTLPSVNTLTNVTTLFQTWRSSFGSAVTNFPDVSALTKATNLFGTWNYCAAAKYFPDVSALTNVTNLGSTWRDCTAATNFPDVSTLTKATSLHLTWYKCAAATNFPAVNTLTNVTTLENTWNGCAAATNFPDVSTLTKVKSLYGTWYNCTATKYFPAVNTLTNVTTLFATWTSCTGMQNTVASLLGDCSWITGQVKNVDRTFENCYDLKGEGMPLVTAITNSPGYPTGYTITTCFQNCTNLTDWATIPAGWK